MIEAGGSFHASHVRFSRSFHLSVTLFVEEIMRASFAFFRVADPMATPLLMPARSFGQTPAVHRCATTKALR